MLDDTLAQTIENNSVELYVGEVVDNKDPEGLNRVRLTISNLLEGGPNDLPWFAPFRLAPFGAGPNFGIYGTPPKGSTLIVMLQGGDVNYGFYVAGYLGLSNKHDTFSNPDVWGFQDPSGTILVVNTKQRTLTFNHPSGYQYAIDSSGNYTMKTPGNHVWNVNGKVDIIANGVTTIKGSTIHLNP